MKYIPLTLGLFASVDDSDFEWLNQWKWYALKNGKTYYAVRTATRKIVPRGKIHMHRALLGLGVGDKSVTDHLDGNGLNNQRSNLRKTNHRTNAQNRGIHRSGLLPGARLKNTGKFESRISIGGRSIYLGVFETAEAAHKAYKLAQEDLV